jgi:hypothetical protein
LSTIVRIPIPQRLAVSRSVPIAHDVHDIALGLRELHADREPE